MARAALLTLCLLLAGCGIDGAPNAPEGNIWSSRSGGVDRGAGSLGALEKSDATIYQNEL
ncbi:hypothetical protein KM176_13245 [Pseudooceanicola sp. CBS1P-1]|uniref:Argininosuccinate lyase n=1 Tax=Pseudooceanicola albus TaxID=2692189 RepID=A0A6L7G3T8_9RHOB|nr:MULTISPECIES: hypothetical protein [Pseudooceanicola]MBT9384829.1 hypothetical protein [Pseudooceanicola endophyticus]MXN18177.1 hypothetical protein [Pseudooceanicola albus]